MYERAECYPYAGFFFKLLHFIIINVFVCFLTFEICHKFGFVTIQVLSKVRLSRLFLSQMVIIYQPDFLYFLFSQVYHLNLVTILIVKTKINISCLLYFKKNFFHSSFSVIHKSFHYLFPNFVLKVSSKILICIFCNLGLGLSQFGL